MTERWLPVPEWEGIYEVSDQGRVRSLPRLRKNGGTWGGKILRPGLVGAGYPSVALCRNGKHRTYLIHQLVAAAFIGPRPAGQEVRHGPPGDRLDNRASNLSYGTPKQNYADMIRDGTRRLHPFGHGADHPRAKLSSQAVADCRNRYEAGETMASLAAEYGVHRTTVRNAVRGRTWTTTDARTSRRPRRYDPGSRHPRAKLTEAIVTACRARFAAGESKRSLAREFGVSSNAMRDAIAGVTWKHVTLLAPPGP